MDIEEGTKEFNDKRRFSAFSRDTDQGEDFNDYEY